MQSQIYVRIGLEEESQGKRENKAGKKAKQAQREQNAEEMTHGYLQTMQKRVAWASKNK